MREACAAAAWLDLGQGREASESAQRALAELTKLPSGRQPVSQTLGAHIDLATAHIMSGELDEACRLVTDTIAVADSTRNASLAGRLARTRSALSAQSLRSGPGAKHLDEIIQEILAGRGMT
jgi:hypothetical protein